MALAGNEERRASFVQRCEEWLCDGHSSDIRYVAVEDGLVHALFDAVIILSPLPASVDNSLALSTAAVIAGQIQTADVPKSELIAMLQEALSDIVFARERKMVLAGDGEFQFQVSSMSADTWFQPLTCQVIGGAPNVIIDRAKLDTMLRASDPPFDGGDDLRNWLGVRLPASGLLSSITITVNPPVDLLTDRSGFVGDQFRLVLASHKNANRELVQLAVRAVPGKGLSSRLQVADRIDWHPVSAGLVEGTVEVSLPDDTGALSLLLVGSETVRRHWFLHPTKAPNYRFAAVKQFDPQLRMIRHGLFDHSDSRRFEAAVTALLFVLGFSAALQLETDAPDIVVATPAGRIVLVECTTRIADISTKTGKLVDRRGALQGTLRSGNKAIDVSAVLVCRLPRDQIAAKASDVAAMGVLLATAEDLTQALTRAELSADADQILTQALQRLPSPSTVLLG